MITILKNYPIMKMKVFSFYSYILHILWMILDILPQSVRNLFFKVLFKKFGKHCTIDYKIHCRYPWRVSIGNQVTINRGTELYPSMLTDAGNIIIEDHAVIAPNCSIFTVSHFYTTLDLPDTSAPVRIGKYAWIGCNTTILPGVEIGEGVVIGAGSLVTKSIPPYSVAMGNPARVVKKRILEDV